MQPDAPLSMHIRHLQKRAGYFFIFAFPQPAGAAQLKAPLQILPHNQRQSPSYLNRSPQRSWSRSMYTGCGGVVFLFFLRARYQSHTYAPAFSMDQGTLCACVMRGFYSTTDTKRGRLCKIGQSPLQNFRSVARIECLGAAYADFGVNTKIQKHNYLMSITDSEFA